VIGVIIAVANVVVERRITPDGFREAILLLADLPPWQIKSAPLGCDKSTRRGKSLRIIRNESQAPKSKIFWFSFDPNQFTDSHRLVPPEGRSRVVTTAGRDAVDARASGAQAIAGRDEPRERNAACRMIGAFCVR
jgi:hypothetical protein